MFKNLGSRNRSRAPNSTPNTISASLVVSRSSGPAPFATVYDASETTCTGMSDDEVFRKCYFLFEVQQNDVTVSGTYITTSLPRYSHAGGPIAAFNILTPGSYTIKLTVTKGIPWVAPASGEAAYRYILGDIVTYNSGTYTCAIAHTSSGSIVPGVHANWVLLHAGLDQTSTTETVTVADPDTSFAGANTICVNTTGVDDGLGPTGCTYASSTGTITSNKRYLFKCGQTFGNISIPLGASNVIIGAYGSGAKPVVGTITAAQSSSNTAWQHTVIIQDLECSRTIADITPYRWTLYNLTVTTATRSLSGIDFGAAVFFYYNNHSTPSSISWPSENFVCECTVDAGADGALIGISGYFNKGGIMGNTVIESHEHSIRTWQSAHTFIGHNDLRGICNAAGKHALKMMSGGNYPDYSTDISVTGDSWPGGLSGVGGPCSQKVVVADNLLGSDGFTGNYIAQIGPQNQDPETVEGLRDMLFERNIFDRPTAGVWTTDLHMVINRGISRWNTASPDGTFTGVGSDNYQSGSTQDGHVIMRNDWSGPYYGQIV